MTVGVWMVPAVLAGLAVILSAATWLERVVAPAAFQVELLIPDAVDYVVAVAAAARAQCVAPDSSMRTERPTIRADMAATEDA